MPKLACLCGYVHDLSPIPDAGWVVVRDADYEAFLEAELLRRSHRDEAPSVDYRNISESDAASARIISMTSRLYECPRCGTLAWDTDSPAGIRFFSPAARPSR